MDPNAPETGTQKQKFKPKVPARRIKKEVKDEAPKQKKPQRKERPARQPVEQIASGPFALGPAERSRGSALRQSLDSIASTFHTQVQEEYDPEVASSEEEELSGDIEWRPVDVANVAREDNSSLTFFQFPKHLPVAVDENAEFGLVGSYIVLEDGTMIVKLGDVEFEAGVSQSVFQELVCVDDDNLVMLGEAGERIVCTPCVDSLLAL
jgi:hypothetical protein